MLTGSTFAWYTATSSSYVNTGVAATFEIKEVTAFPGGAAAVSTADASNGIQAERDANGIWKWDAQKANNSVNEYTVNVSVDTTTDMGCIIISYKEDEAGKSVKDTYIEIAKTDAKEKTVKVETDAETGSPADALTSKTEVQHIATKTFKVQLDEGRTLADIEIRALWGQAPTTVNKIVSSGSITVPTFGDAQPDAPESQTNTQTTQDVNQTPQTGTQETESPTTPATPNNSEANNNSATNNNSTSNGGVTGTEGPNDTAPVVPETQESVSTPTVQSEPSAQS